jgi:hypothetical protein
MHPDNRSRIYFVVVSRRGNGANPFGWEIQRRTEAMGVKVSGDGYRSHREAQEAGKSALDRFLHEWLPQAVHDGRNFHGLPAMKAWATLLPRC